jgi:hypothetical protein
VIGEDEAVGGGVVADFHVPHPTVANDRSELRIFTSRVLSNEPLDARTAPGSPVKSLARTQEQRATGELL